MIWACPKLRKGRAHPLQSFAKKGKRIFTTIPHAKAALERHPDTEIVLYKAIVIRAMSGIIVVFKGFSSS